MRIMIFTASALVLAGCGGMSEDAHPQWQTMFTEPCDKDPCPVRTISFDNRVTCIKTQAALMTQRSQMGLPHRRAIDCTAS